MSIILETERLVLRKFNITDAEFILELLNAPTWIRYIGDRGIRTIADAQTYLVKIPLMSYAVNGFGLYLVELKHNQTPIGMCGLLKREYLKYMDIGYALLPEYEGQGYAYEIASATVNYAFEQYNLTHLSAITSTTNEPSKKLLHKLGFTFEHTVYVDKEDLLVFIKDARKHKRGIQTP